MTGPKVPGQPGEPDDAAITLVDRVIEDAARDAAANPGPPSAAAHALSRMARSLVAGREPADRTRLALGSMDGEPAPTVAIADGVVRAVAPEVDSERLRVMPRHRLLSTLVSLANRHGEALDPSMARASDADLRDAIRRRR